MVELTDTEKQQIFLTLNNIFKTMTGLKNDLLIKQNQIERKLLELEIKFEKFVKKELEHHGCGCGSDKKIDIQS